MSHSASGVRRGSKLLAALLIIIWLLRHLVGELTGPTLLLCAVPNLVWALLILIAAAGWRYGEPRRARVWVAGGLAIMIFSEPGLPFPELYSSASFTVMQLNMQHGLGGEQRVADLIRKHEAAVVFLQEAGPLDAYNAAGPLLDALADYRLSRDLTRSNVGQYEVIAVRGPIFRVWEEDLPEMPHEARLRGKRLTAIETELGGQRIILAVVHLSPIQGSPSELARVRSEQWRRVAAFVRRQTLPVVLAGDFNNGPHGPGYRELSAEATDVFRALGVGLGNTMPSSIPLRRIDYIWTKGDLMPQTCEVLPDRVSDHRAILSRIGLYEK